MPSSNLAEFRHLRSGSLNIPAGHEGGGIGGGGGGGRPNGMMSPIAAGGAGGGAARFDGPRSPPNTAHVPCKFFRQSACQAGNACPFSHDLSNASENVCKYFAKGNCKFGPKCANIHVLPDGRRINYGKNGVTIGAAPINLGARVNPITTYHHPSNSALTSSFMRADVVPQIPGAPYGGGGGGGGIPYIPAGGIDDYYPQIPPTHHQQNHHLLGRQPSMENGLPTIDTTYSSNPTSVYGSPRDDESTLGRFGMGLSPVNVKGLSVLDAPLPASFDSNGISHAARYGPWPSSVPSKFGLESPSTSINAAKDARTSETLKLLHTSAFGSSEHLRGSSAAAAAAANANAPNAPTTSSALAAAMRAEAGVIGTSLGGIGLGSASAGLTTGSSPPVNAGSDDFFGGAKRATVMHSASNSRFAKPRGSILSASAPKVDRDWEAEFLFLEEDYVPSALANDVLTPQEKARRGSVRLTDDPATSSGVLSGGVEASPSSLPKFGSPGASAGIAMAASPTSRWGPLFQRQREDSEASLSDPPSSSPAGPGRAMKHAASAFGHVGSPLRNSSLAMDVAADLNGLARRPTGGAGAGLGTGAGVTPTFTPEAGGLSVLTQQLQRTKLGTAQSNSNGTGAGPGGPAADDALTSPLLHPGAAAARPGAAIPLIPGRDHQHQQHHRGLERHVSTSSIGSSGRFTTPMIDEEDPAFVFNMEEEDLSQIHTQTHTQTSIPTTMPTTTMQHQVQQQHVPSVVPATPLRPTRKRLSAGGGIGGWSYAGVVAAATAASNRETAKGVNGSSSSGASAVGSAAGGKGRDGGAVEAVVGGR